MAKRKKKTINNKKKSKVDGSAQVESQGEYYVEQILDWGVHDNGTMMYLVKWWHYPQEENSWEFEAHVSQCDDYLTLFHTQAVNGRHPAKYSFDEFDKLCLYLKQLIQSPDLAVYKRLSKRAIDCFEIRTNKIREEIKEVLRTQLSLLSEKKSKLKTRNNTQRLEAREVVAKVVQTLNIQRNFQSLTEFFEFVDQRRRVLKKLSKWEERQNTVIASECEGRPIRVVNDVDLDKPVLKRYITDYIIDEQYGTDIELEEEEPLVSCKCDDCYESRDECCTAVIGFPMVYNSRGLLSSLRFNTIVFECNSKCKCDQSCPNRQIQRGRQFNLEIFRTDSAQRGWGVRTLEVIPKGAFITKYTGEVISLLEAEKRPTTYLFDLSTHLDSSDVEFTYVVDASNCGNVTRFVNHSCAPNCRVLFAWINRSTNKLLPIIALFAIKPIKPYEELTYDYSMEIIDYYNQSSEHMSDTGSEVSESGEQMNDSEKREVNANMDPVVREHPNRKVAFKQIGCECGARDCRKFLYS